MFIDLFNLLSLSFDEQATGRHDLISDSHDSLLLHWYVRFCHRNDAALWLPTCIMAAWINVVIASLAIAAHQQIFDFIAESTVYEHVDERIDCGIASDKDDGGDIQYSPVLMRRTEVSHSINCQIW